MNLHRHSTIIAEARMVVAGLKQARNRGLSAHIIWLLEHMATALDEETTKVNDLQRQVKEEEGEEEEAP